jgi:hypothetical protein
MKHLFFPVMMATALLPAMAQAAQPKRAPSPFACAPLASLNSRAQECDDNVVYAEAGVLCLRKLQNLVKEKQQAAKKALRASNEAHLSGGKNSQAAGQAGAASDYNISSEVLDELISAAKQANGQVSGYLDHIYMPEDMYLVDNGLDPDDILLENACYAENQEVLVMVESDINDIIKDLEATKAASGKLQGQSSGNHSDQSSLTDTGHVDTRGKASASPAPKGRDWRESDISKRKKKKDQ